MYAIGLSPWLRADLWPDNNDLRTATGLALDAQCRADGLGALAHNAQPQVLQCDTAWIETLPIIADSQFYLIGPTV